MTRFRRLAVLLVPLVVGLAATVLPGRAQQATSSRYAFADTLLLRDTLGLDFSRLFPTADSVRVLPDTLRAWMIRWRLTIPRMLSLADSLGYPVDSVGPVLDRERFNPLAARGSARTTTDFRYSSTYTIGQTSTNWSNGADYTLTRGGLFVQNSTKIGLDRFTTGGRLSLRQERSAATETGWRFSKDLSVGGRVNLSRFLSSGSLGSGEGETKNEFQVSMRSRQTPRRSLTSELNFFTGLLDLNNSSQLKRGFSGDLNGRARYNGGWLTHDLTGQMTGNLSRTRVPTAAQDLSTRDFSNNLRGTLGMYQNSPLGLVVNYQLRRSRVETPAGDSAVNRIITVNNSLDGTFRARLDNDRYLTTTGRLGSSQQSIGTRDDRSGEASLRWLLAGWALDARYRDNRSTARSPKRGTLFGYDERTTNRLAEGTATRQFGRSFNAKVTSNIGLDRSRYLATADSVQLPVDRDNFRQSYRLEGIYTASEKLNSGVGVEVSLSSLINIPGRATASNTDLRSYRADWRWTYRLLRGLTANQTNSVTAEYRFFPFASDRNDLSLDYNSITNLSATVTPRLSINLSHNLREQPKGTYQVREDGLAYLLPSDEGRNYTLRANVTYSPTPALSLTLAPDYQETSRVGNQNGVEVPQRRSKSLNFSGGANLNLTLGQKGLLTGSIARTFQASRSTTFQSGVPQVTPASEVDFWNGALQLSWSL